VTGKGPAHYRGDYAARARAIRTAARLDPATRCHRCHLTQAEYAATHGDRAATWQAGHLINGQVDGWLAPEHARCNASAGATHGNTQRQHPSRNWYA
jgi:hypothetical protein